MTLGWHCSEQSRGPNPPSWTQHREGDRRPRGGNTTGVGWPWWGTCTRGSGSGADRSGTCAAGKCEPGGRTSWLRRQRGATGASTAPGMRPPARPGGPWSGSPAEKGRGSSPTPWGGWPGSAGTRPSSFAGTGRVVTAGTTTCSTHTPGRTAVTSAWTAGATASSGGSLSPSRAPGCRKGPSTHAHSNRSRRGRS